MKNTDKLIMQVRGAQGSHGYFTPGGDGAQGFVSVRRCALHRHRSLKPFLDDLLQDAVRRSDKDGIADWVKRYGHDPLPCYILDEARSTEVAKFMLSLGIDCTQKSAFGKHLLGISAHTPTITCTFLDTAIAYGDPAEVVCLFQDRAARSGINRHAQHWQDPVVRGYVYDTFFPTFQSELEQNFSAPKALVLLVCDYANSWDNILAGFFE